MNVYMFVFFASSRPPNVGMLEVSPSGEETVLHLEKDAWEMFN